MIVGGRIEKVEGERTNDGIHKGLDVNIGIDGVTKKDDYIEIKYTYEVKYKENIGYIRVTGYLYAKEENEKEILEHWEKNKRLPLEYTETILNAVNYTGSYNATLIAKVVNLGAPFVTSRIQVKKK